MYNASSVTALNLFGVTCVETFLFALLIPTIAFHKIPDLGLMIMIHYEAYICSDDAIKASFNQLRPQNYHAQRSFDSRRAVLADQRCGRVPICSSSELLCGS